MKQTIWRWINRGILGIVALFAFLAVSFALFLIWEKHRLAEFNKTHERPLLKGSNDPVLANAHNLLAQLKRPIGKDSLRFAVMPSFGKRWFAVSVDTINGRGVGEAIVLMPSGKILREEMFDVPNEELRLFLSQWDEITDGYTGEGSSVSDGNPLAFERRRDTRITSGEGNSPCHYDVLGDLAAQSLGHYIPELNDLRNPMLPVILKSRFCNRSIFTLR